MAATSSLSTNFSILPLSNSSSKRKPSPFSFSPAARSHAPPPALKVSATPEIMESPVSLEASSDVEGFGEVPSTLPIGGEADQLAPKQKIRIKLRSYWVNLIEDSCKQILEAARTTNAKTMGPVPLPTKKRVYCVLKSPHVHKDARFHFEIRTHQRMIDILYPTAQTIDSLMQLDLPAGVDVEVKL